MKIVNEFGQETKIITENDIFNETTKCMYLLFETMLKEHYSIDAEEFKEIVKIHFPEKHI